MSKPRSQHSVTITLDVTGPILVKSSAPAAFGIDAACARVTYGPKNDRDKVCIPYSLLKGKLAEACAQLAGLDRSFETFSEKWLGQESAQGTNDPDRGRMWFCDLVATEKGSPKQQTRIAIEPVLGSVKHQMLQFSEQPFAAGALMQFKGEVRFIANDEETKEACEKLRLALCWITQLGSQRSVGFGRLRRVSLSASPPKHPGPEPQNGKAPVRLQLDISPQAPFCIGKHKIGDNLFESLDIIPGNVLAGAVAETWLALNGLSLSGTNGVSDLAEENGKRFPTLGKHLSALRFRHAFPTQTANRPKAVPLSVVSIPPPKKPGDDPDKKLPNEYRDVVACESAVVFRRPPVSDGGPKTCIAAAFRTDWKWGDYENVDPKYGWAAPARELRVRTAIDSIHRRADQGDGSDVQGKLFALEMVHPYTEGNEPITWRTCVDLEAVADKTVRPAVAQELEQVLSVLGSIGKTKTACKVAVHASTLVDSIPDPFPDMLRLVLQSQALLCDPRYQCNPPESGSITAEKMKQLYRQTWDELSDYSLVLQHYYASQSLAGGNYLYQRFLKPRQKPYNPWLLTDAGSVFVFKVADTVKAAAKLKTWQASGLPLPEWAVKAFGDQWNENPFIPQNGFGEVAPHESRGIAEPGADEWTSVPPTTGVAS